MEQLKIDLHSTVTALSSSLDLVGIDEVKHGKRVAIMAKNVARELGWSKADCLTLMHAGMLHDCGVSRVEEHRLISETLEWDGAEVHCIRGHAYLRACAPLAHLAVDVRYHHTRWEKLQNLPLSETTRLRTNLIYLADRADTLQLPYIGSEQILLEYPTIVDYARKQAGRMFAPELVEAFAHAADEEAFWLSMAPEYLDEELAEFSSHQTEVTLNLNELRALALLFSRIVDAKSHYTEEHSERVAKIARYLAEQLGRTGPVLDLIEIAGLLHDIGKLRVDEAIIEKPGPLTDREYACIRRHSYDTYRILRRVFGHTPIPVWAGYHHENLLGLGYPFKRAPKEIHLESRIVSVADIFQAFAQNRSYRGRLAKDEIIGHLQELVAQGRLDAQVVGVLIDHGDECYRLATA
jgi:putative nucleotidyltransferase with HDIG domain